MKLSVIVKDENWTSSSTMWNRPHGDVKPYFNFGVYTAQAQARAVENRVHLINSKFGRAMPSRRFAARTAAHVHCPGAGTQLATGIRDVERDAASTSYATIATALQCSYKLLRTLITTTGCCVVPSSHDGSATLV